MQATLFKRPSGLQCFFCQSPVSPVPRNAQSFRCPHCTCLNRYDASGEIISDEPAMHDESLNSRSFAKRASPSKDRLPTAYGKGPFCHTCQTNQMLLMNLLSNYLPSPNSPEYLRRLEMFPDYRESLHLRYPPVCESCLPAVQDEIRRKDHMARTRALGGWLNQSKGKEKQRRVSVTITDRENAGVQLLAWRIRGCLWATTLLCAVMGDSAGAFGNKIPHWVSPLKPALPVIIFISILWTVWDPTYASFRKAQLQDRDVRVKGKTQYIILQLTVWFSRLVTATILFFHPDIDYLHLSHDLPSTRSRVYFSVSLAIELCVLLASSAVLRLQQPPAIRLLDTKLPSLPASRQATPNPTNHASPVLGTAEPDLFASLTLSSKPVLALAGSKPIFGHPSLVPAPPRVDDGMVDDEDAMDWTPTDPSGAHPRTGKEKHTPSDDSAWLRPQRFFAPEKPTGLEGLFERTKLVDESEPQRPPLAPGAAESHIWRWWIVHAMSLVPLAGVGYAAWTHAASWRSG